MMTEVAAEAAAGADMVMASIWGLKRKREGVGEGRKGRVEIDELKVEKWRRARRRDVSGARIGRRKVFSE